jgi:hypothetical protein
MPDNTTPRGYLLSDLTDVFARYVPVSPPIIRNVRNNGFYKPKTEPGNPQPNPAVLRFENGGFPHGDGYVADVAHSGQDNVGSTTHTRHVELNYGALRTCQTCGGHDWWVYRDEGWGYSRCLRCEPVPDGAAIARQIGAA